MKNSLPIDSSENRSPLKGRPLRSPGQSCDEQRRKLLEEKIELPITVAVTATALAGLEAWRAHSNLPPQPWPVAMIAFAAIVFALMRVRRYLPLARNLSQAAAGERAVGQYLEKLRASDFEIFHDVPALGFNVDHVLIGPSGVFTVETKTWSKPERGDARISFDGEQILAGGYVPDRDPVVQARAQASWVARLIEEGTGRKYPVRPVVLFPGWWIEQTEKSLKELWVLEPKALPGFLANEPTRLDKGDIKLAAYHLSRYIRTFEVD